MEYNDKLPIFELKIANDPDKLYEGLSLVDEPAIEKNFLYFDADKIIYQFSDDDWFELLDILDAYEIKN